MKIHEPLGDKLFQPSSSESNFRLHLPLNKVDVINLPPLYFLWVQDALILAAGTLWTAAYILYIREGFRAKSYGMPVVALCANIAWELVYGVFYPLSIAEQITFVPWFFIDLVLAYTTVEYGPRRWTDAPLITNNLACIIISGSLLFLAGHLAFIHTCANHDIAAFWSGFCCQILLGTSSVAQLMARNDAGGHSGSIWICRLLGSLGALLMFNWRHWHYPDDYPYVGTPMAMFIFITQIATDVTYGFIYVKVQKSQRGKEKST